MGMIFCRACGQQIHESAVSCPHCGASSRAQPAQPLAPPPPPLPEGVVGWSWGALFLNLIWAIGNRTWIGLLTLIPVVGWVMPFVLGAKGREWAWKSGNWRNVEHFNTVQKKWDRAAFVSLGAFAALIVVAGIAVPAYDKYQERKAEAEIQAAAQAAPNPRTLADLEKAANTYGNTNADSGATPTGPDNSQAASANDPNTTAPISTTELLSVYNTADTSLNATYKATMAKISPAVKQVLRDQQRQWIKQRDASCGTLSTQDESVQRTTLQCLIGATQTRTQEIATM